MPFIMNLRGLRDLAAGKSVRIPDGVHPTVTEVFLDREARRVLAQCLLPVGSEGGYILPPELNNDEGREKVRRVYEGAKEIDVVKVLMEPEEECEACEDKRTWKCPDCGKCGLCCPAQVARSEERAWRSALLDVLNGICTLSTNKKNIEDLRHRFLP